MIEETREEKSSAKCARKTVATDYTGSIYKVFKYTPKIKKLKSFYLHTTSAGCAFCIHNKKTLQLIVSIQIRIQR